MTNRKTAIQRLERRWHEQVEKFPRMREEIPLETYVASNVGIVMKRDLLQSYDKPAA